MTSMYESAIVKAVNLLEERGYSVQLEAESSSRKGLRADILGWGKDDSGKAKVATTSYEMVFMKMAEKDHKTFDGLETAPQMAGRVIILPRGQHIIHLSSVTLSAVNASATLTN